MNASKENAAKALAIVNSEKLPSPHDRQFLREFIEAAQRKLPREAAFAADKKRRPVRAK